MTRSTAPRILLVEDDVDAAELVRETLTDHFKSDCVTHVDHIADALAVDLDSFDLVLSDINLPDGSGLELLDQLLRRRPDIPIIMVTSESALDCATDAIRKGAYDYVVKAGEYLFTIPLIVEKNLAVYQIKQRNDQLQQELGRTLEQLQQKNNQLQEVISQLERQAATDPLTGLANRRHIQTILERSFSQATRYHTDLAVLMIDMDGFKQFNDTRGHQAGDQLLQAMAYVLVQSIRRSDVAGRYGGDEFVVIQPHADPILAQQFADRIRQQFLAHIRELFGRQTPCDLSIGIACLSISKPTSADQLVALADSALYRAKQAGKARAVLHNPVELSDKPAGLPPKLQTSNSKPE